MFFQNKHLTLILMSLFLEFRFISGSLQGYISHIASLILLSLKRKWGHFSVFQTKWIYCSICYGKKGNNQIFLTEVEHQNDGRMLCK